MKKTILAAVLSALCIAAAVSAPVVVTPGSNSGYLYFPKGSSSGGTDGGSVSGGKPGVTIDGMQLARTACYTVSGSVALPTGFTAGYIQAIVVGGGQGSATWGGNPAGQSSSITHADIGTVTAPGGSSSTAGSRGGGTGGVWGSEYVQGGFGGGGGGYLGKGGNGGPSANYPAPGGGGGGSRGGGGQGFGYGEPSGGSGGAGAYGGPNSQTSPAGPSGSVGLQPDAPAVIVCPNVPSAASNGGGTGFGAGGGGDTNYPGGNSGQIATVVWKYTGGPITVVVGSGGAGGAPGVVALRFIPQ